MPGSKVVVTGFGPFGGISENSSTIAALNLKNKWANILSDSKASTELIVIPDVEVSYVTAAEVAATIWDEIKPDLVIHAGLHYNAEKVYIETQSTSGPYLGFDPDDCQPSESCPNCICSDLNLKEACKELQNLGFECDLSNDPGAFVCGYTYYRSLERNPCRSVFIHVPPISESFSADYLGNFLLSLISILCRQCNIPTSPALHSYLLETNIAKK
nr:Peptidase C15 pyroglutamyl peptidase I [Hymenolepis microstoma]